VVYRPFRLTPAELEAGYWRAYRSFYRWSSILRGAATKPSFAGAVRHVAYAGGWKKLEPFWDLVIRAKRVSALLPALESVLAGFIPSSRDRALAGARVEAPGVAEAADLTVTLARATLQRESLSSDARPASDRPGSR
jgi:hypothetical protein